MGWTVRGSNPSGGEIFRICPDRPWGPASLLYKGHRVSFTAVKRPGSGVDQPPTSSNDIKRMCRATPLLPFRGFRVCYRANLLYNYTALVTNIIILVTFTVVTLVTKFISIPINTMAKMITNFIPLFICITQ